MLVENDVDSTGRAVPSLVKKCRIRRLHLLQDRNDINAADDDDDDDDDDDAADDDSCCIFDDKCVL